MNAVVALPGIDELRNYVKLTLCERDRLVPEQTPLLECPLTRSGRTCGRFFSIDGPRLLKSYALWAGEEDRILFYDSTGARFAEVRLSEAPAPE
jgi:hypothetical protein